VALVLAAGFGVATAAESKKARYPYDPACQWGRIANGKGMLLRCITEQEAHALLKGPSEAPKPPEPDAGVSGEPARELSVEVGPIKADEGEIDVGRLDVPKDRYAACVAEHGGLQDKAGEVQVRFLVRGARGRAEGVSVSKRQNVSKEAARCVANVVDRRKVGIPSAPMVGVTLTIKFTQ
jgi:hypothetical protein